MRRIQKIDGEPKILTDFKDSCYCPETGNYINCSYPNFKNPERGMYKLQLLREQHFLCAYCNKEIEESTSTIEHWTPWHQCVNLPTFGTRGGEDINHQNLIAVCLGNNSNPHFNHCDKERAKLSNHGQALTIRPQASNYSFEATFTYIAGRLKCNGNNAIQDDVDRKLNLNHEMLIHFRKVVLDQFIKNLRGNKDVGFLVHQLDRYNTPSAEGKLRNYCTVITNYINKKLA